jgi:hypothetical protein
VIGAGRGLPGSERRAKWKRASAGLVQAEAAAEEAHTDWGAAKSQAEAAERRYSEAKSQAELQGEAAKQASVARRALEEHQARLEEQSRLEKRGTELRRWGAKWSRWHDGLSSKDQERLARYVAALRAEREAQAQSEAQRRAQHQQMAHQLDLEHQLDPGHGQGIEF